jgi:hypothetical protein
MNMDFDGPTWADHHDKLSDAIGVLATAIGHAFDRLQAYQYDAPWRRAAGRERRPLHK